MLFFSISCGKVTQLYEERGILREQIQIAGDKLQINSLSPYPPPRPGRGLGGEAPVYK